MVKMDKEIEEFFLEQFARIKMRWPDFDGDLSKVTQEDIDGVREKLESAKRARLSGIMSLFESSGLPSGKIFHGPFTEKQMNTIRSSQNGLFYVAPDMGIFGRDSFYQFASCIISMNIPILYVSAIDAQSRLDKFEKPEEESYFDFLCSCKILFVDDFGAEPESRRVSIATVILHRLRNAQRTFVNLSLQCELSRLAERYRDAGVEIMGMKKCPLKKD